MAREPYQHRHPGGRDGNSSYEGLDRHRNWANGRNGRQGDHHSNAVTAPFRFARIPRVVHYPAWGDLVSHDVPFADGHNGVIEIGIRAVTPLLVGRGRDRRQTPGTALPFRAPDGSYAIPGSGLQGVIRAILEVATFGKLGPGVKDRRFGYRDVNSGITPEKLYKSLMNSGNGSEASPIRSKVKTGWLVKGSEGRHSIFRSSMARIEMSQVASGDLLGQLMRKGQHRDTRAWQDAPGRYSAFLGTKAKTALDRDFFWPSTDNDRHGPHGHSCGLMSYDKCLGSGAPDRKFSGTLVLTGKSASTQNGRGEENEHTKHMEFVFHSPSRAEFERNGAAEYGDQRIEIPDDVWRDFQLIHEPDKTSGGKINPTWDYWKGEFRTGNPVPVFYLQEGGKITAMGMAQMFKLAMPLSTHQMLENSSAEHVSTFDGKANGETGKLDMAALIFGANGGKEGNWFSHSLKRRASFDMARLTGNGQVRQGQPIGPVPMLSPKPSYFPSYVRQAPSGNHRIEHRQPYAAYHDTGGTARETRTPELAGVKIWPADLARQNGSPRNHTGYDPDGPLRNVLSFLDAVPAGATFTTRLRIHNLRRVELGALLWALSFGKEDAFTQEGTDICRHRLGGGKPFGLGEAEIRITGMVLDRNDGARVESPGTLIDAFKQHMNAVFPEWENSTQVKALMKAATPADYKDRDELKYIATPKSHMDLRKNGHFLPDFVDGHEPALTRSSLPSPDTGTNVAAPARKPVAPAHQPAAPAYHRPAAQTRQWPRIEDAPVRHADGREGFIREAMHNSCRVSVNGVIEIWANTAFVVTGPAEDE